MYILVCRALQAFNSGTMWLNRTMKFALILVVDAIRHMTESVEQKLKSNINLSE
jgi:hypothetical protein